MVPSMILCRGMAMCALLAGISAGAVTNDAAATPDAPIPRYKLAAGQEPIYQTGRATITFYVTRANPNGGWHLFELYNAPGLAVRNPSTGEPISLPSDLKCEFDLMPDGKVDGKPIGVTGDLQILLPMLPADAATTDWKMIGPQGQPIRFHAVPATQPSMRDFEVETDGPMERLAKIHVTRRVRFDISQGVPVRIEINAERLSNHKQSPTTVELSSSQVHPASWTKLIAREADAVVQAHSRYREAIDAASSAQSDREVLAGFAAALADLKNARAQITVPALAEVMDGYIALHPIYVYRGRGPEALLGQPAPGWEFEDLQGKRHALKDYRGKVVVLDFWYRGCGWCVIEMPQLKRIAQRYAGKPVAFLGMNVDADPRDAQYMADKQQLTYPTLVTRALAKTTAPATQPAARRPAIDALYHVHGYPTLIVIDADGIVRHVETGYHPGLEDGMPKEIDKLLLSDKSK